MLTTIEIKDLGRGFSFKKRKKEKSLPVYLADFLAREGKVEYFARRILIDNVNSLYDSRLKCFSNTRLSALSAEPIESTRKLGDPRLSFLPTKQRFERDRNTSPSSRTRNESDPFPRRNGERRALVNRRKIGRSKREEDPSDFPPVSN